MKKLWSNVSFRPSFLFTIILFCVLLPISTKLLADTSADSIRGRLQALEREYPGLTTRAAKSLSSPLLAPDAGAALAGLELRLAAASPAVKEAFRMVLNPESFAKESAAMRKDHAEAENCAFTLYLFLLSKNLFIKDDVITEALALANSHIFFLADNAARQLIASDAADHFDFYRELISWQESQKLPWSLAEVSVIPKIFWADRCRYQMSEITGTLVPENGYKLGPEEYREFADSPAVLREIHLLIVRENLVSPGLSKTAGVLEDFVQRKRKYRSTMENLADFNSRLMFSDEDFAVARAEFAAGQYETTLFGKNRRWDEFRWLNYQWQLFESKGFFQGDCGDTTVAQMGFYRAAGICPVSMQWVHPEHVAAFMHNFPGYYHPVLGRWYSVQKPFFFGPGGGVLEKVDIYFYWTKPYWHNLLDTDDFREKKPKGYPVYFTAFYQGELTDSTRLTNLLSMGIPEKTLNPLFFSTITQTPGTLINAKTAPPAIPDEDRDLLPDTAETDLGTDPGNPDTDGDGVSDFWELERGYNPLSKTSAPRADNPPIDGIAGFELTTVQPSAALRTATVTDPKGDETGDPYFPDIASVSARVYPTGIFVSVTFHGNTDPYGRLLAHSLLLTKRNPEKETYYIQKYWESFTVVRKITAVSDEWVKEEPKGGLEFSLSRDAEFFIPIEYVSGCDTVYISYRAGGQSLEKGSFLSDTDISPPLRLPLREADFSLNLESIMKDAPEWKDREGDVMSLPGMKDIRSVSVKTVGSDMYAYLRYYGDTQDLPFGLQSFQLRGKNTGTNYWVQWWETDSVGIWTWRDGEASVPFVSADLSGFDACPVEDGIYFRLDTGLWREEQVLYLICHSGGFIGKNKTENSADTLGNIRISLESPDPREKLIAASKAAASLKDSRNDMSAYTEYLDIASFRAGPAGEFLVSDAVFFNDKTAVPFGIHSFHIRDEGTTENWWIQWTGFGMVNYYFWKDGQELALRNNFTNLFDCLDENGRYIFIMPLRVFFDGNAGAYPPKTRNLSMRYITGGLDKNGKQVIEADGTDFLDIEVASPRN